MSISLTHKYRILFCSVNVNGSEEVRTFDRAVPRFSGVIGKMQIKGVRRRLCYGVTATLSDGLNVPLPYVGGTGPMGDRWSFHYVLPLQLAIGYKAGKRTRLLAGVGADGFRSGFAQADDRVNIHYSALRGFIHFATSCPRPFSYAPK